VDVAAGNMPYGINVLIIGRITWSAWHFVFIRSRGDTERKVLAMLRLPSRCAIAYSAGKVPILDLYSKDALFFVC